jgi:glucokinase
MDKTNSGGNCLNIGVDLGGTKIAMGLVSSEGVLLSQNTASTNAQNGPEYVIKTIVTEIQNLLKRKHLNNHDINSIGIGVPGTVDLKTGEVILAPNIYWTHVPLGLALKETFSDISIFIDQDTNAAAYGEFLTYNDPIDNLYYITLSTGVGSGIIINKKLYRGCNNTAGEVGHTIVVKDGLLCECGNRGCLQVYSKGPAIAREAERRIKRGEKSSLSKNLKNDELTAIQVTEAALIGDPLAKDVVLRAAEYIGIALANVVSLLNPDLIVIGGGVARCGKMLLDRIYDITSMYCYPPACEHLRIECTDKWEQSGVIGAALLYKTL